MNVDENIKKEDAFSKIELPENLDQIVKESVEKGYEIMKKNKANKKAFMVKRAAIIIGILAAGGVVTIPVKAYVNSLIQERMEQIPEKEINDIVEVIDEQPVEADTYSREYSKMEEDKLKDLRNAYGEGTFPKNELLQEKTYNKDMTQELYFAQDTSTFYLPERELTDEELLQIIDFNTKRDYALAQRYEDGISEEQKVEDQKTRDKLKEEGGITEAEAIALGKEWITKLYGISGEGMELYPYLEQDNIAANGPAYNITFNIRSVQNCFFVMDAYSGELISAEEILVSDDINKAPVSTSILAEKKDTLFESAKNVLVKQLGKEAEYEKVVLAYNESDGCLGYLNQVLFFFVKSDGSAYEIGMSAVRERFMSYTERSNFEEYKKEMKEMESRQAEESGKKSNFAVPAGTMVYEELQIN